MAKIVVTFAPGCQYVSRTEQPESWETRRVAAAQMGEIDPWSTLERHVPHRPLLDAKVGDLPSISKLAWDALVAANEPPVLFRRGGAIVRIQLDDSGLIQSEPLNPDRLRHRVARVALWSADGELVPPPTAVIRDMMAAPDPPLPVLERIVRVPLLAPDGSVRTKAGYHRAGRILLAPVPGLRVPEVNPTPTPDDVALAVRLITEELLGDFPFMGPAEQAHAVALGLLPFCRALIEGPTPLHLVEKPSPGTGATLLADVLAFISTGTSPSTLTEGSSEEEWRKRLTAKLASAPEIVLIDNVRARLSSAALASAITSPVWEDRQLGQTRMLRLPVRCAWVATGNNPVLTREMARRSARIRLDAGMDRPWQRAGFRHPALKQWVGQNHGELVWAFLTLVTSWVAAGRPPGGRELGMFERWSQTVGGILQVAGIDGFLGNVEDEYGETDREATAWSSLVTAWWRRFGTRPVGTSELYPLASQYLGLGPGGDRSQRTRLGIALAEARDRRFGHLSIRQAGNHRGAALWTLVEVGRTM